MKFSIVTVRAAERDFNTILAYVTRRSKVGGQSWARAFDKALAFLEKNANTCPFAAESEHVDFEVRETLFRTRRGLMY